jgi:hypothetical protein
VRSIRLFSLCLALSGAVLAPADALRAAGSTSETLQGEMIGPGVECPLFRLTDGEIISLTGLVPDVQGSYALTGRWSRFSKCMEGRSFQVLQSAPIESKEN